MVSISLFSIRAPKFHSVHNIINKILFYLELYITFMNFLFNLHSIFLKLKENYKKITKTYKEKKIYFLEYYYYKTKTFEMSCVI